MKVLFTGGGTGGHIFPIIAIVREIRRLHPKEDIQFYYFGPKDEFGSIFLSQEGIKTKTIFAGKIRRYLGAGSIFQNLIDIFFRLPIGFFQSFFRLFFLFPDLIFSKGGYGSLPVVFAGWLLRAPIFLHESDISPGLANRILSKLALEVFTSFPKTEYFSPKKMILVGNPVRREIVEGSAETAEKLFKLKGGKPKILILGGSQGALRINDMLLNILPELLSDFEVIHQGGTKNFRQLLAEVQVVLGSSPEDNQELRQYYHPYSFLKETELKHAYRAADLIVSRAGSGSIFEIAALGKPSILIPLPESAQNHQIKNAYAYAKTGAAIVIEEENLSPHFFLEKLRYLFSHPEELEKMSQAAREFSRPQASRILAEYIINYLLS
jgi:UDP-N-acetylglucosamine--N-acetylmuramyl-(pentapeptide) pyrophosphoryl-undecaprenol N-acetylglucosamine transferase